VLIWIGRSGSLSRQQATSVQLSPSNFETPRKRRRGQQPATPAGGRGERDLFDPLTVPLPASHSVLVTLHASLERALLLHLATSGASSLPPTLPAPPPSPLSSSSSPLEQEPFTVRLPNLVSYRTIRPVVERGAGHSFTELELSRLLAVWDEEGDDGKLGLIVTPHRELDRTTGNKVYTYGIGIELRIRRNEPRPELEIVGVGGSPGAGGGAGGGGGKRSNRNSSSMGMNVVALWSQGSEGRREEVRRRLGRKVLQAHEVSTLLFFLLP
jgi:hypothetical protein